MTDCTYEICDEGCKTVSRSSCSSTTVRTTNDIRNLPTETTPKPIPICEMFGCSENDTYVPITNNNCSLAEKLNCLYIQRVYDPSAADGCCYRDECQDCKAPTGESRQIGEQWISYCQNCSCDIEKSVTFVTCEPIICETSKTCKPGSVAVKVQDASDICCPKIECRCTSQTCSEKEAGCPRGFDVTCVNSDQDGCCPTLNCTRKPVCLVENMEYPIGAFVYTANEPCSECYCSDEIDPATQMNLVKCEPTKCFTDCQQGYEYKIMATECCGICVQVACIFKNTTYTTQVIQPGDTWIPYSKDSCTAYTCSYVNGQFILSESSKNCTPPKQPICNPGEIPFNCCYACDPALCKLKTRPLEIDEGLTATKITDSYCELEDSTASLYPPEVYKAMLSCQCCKMVQSSMKTVTLIFKDGQSIEYKYSYAEKCGCTSCK